MNYSIIEWQHSADKDHTNMTGWTLTVDKKVQCDEGITFYTYNISLYKDMLFDENFHRWIHSAEHLLAYKKDTGSVRNSLEEVTAWELQWKVILDISPYQTGKETFGFRITSMVPLKIDQLQELFKLSTQRAIDFLENAEIENKNDFQWIPFARSISCWQYDFHDKQRAVSDLKSIDLHNLTVTQNTSTTNHTTAYVCDLRFLKPKLDGRDDMIMFSPDFSYQISELIEAKLPEKLGWNIVLVGTFGCMTGMYLCTSSEIWDESDIAHIHALIIEILKENIEINNIWKTEQIQFQTLLENYEKYSL